VRERIIDEAHGNPLAVLELPRGESPLEVTDEFMVNNPLRLEAGFRWRVDQLPADSRQLLLIAAAEPLGDPDLLWRAAESLGITTDALTAAEAEGLLEVGERVTFRHPLVRSAIYGSAGGHARRTVHQALAAATDGDAEPDHRAWHRAQGAQRRDEAIAKELERCAQRSQTRGCSAAASMFMERAATLTPDRKHRTSRHITAAQLILDAGDAHAAQTLAAVARVNPLDRYQRAQLDTIDAHISLTLEPLAQAVPQLMRAAEQLESLDPGLARQTYLEALDTAIKVDRESSGQQLAVGVAQAVRAVTETAVDPLLAGLSTQVIDGYAAAAPILQRAVTDLRSSQYNTETIRRVWLGCQTAVDIWDDVGWDELANRQVQIARNSGALAVLPQALIVQATYCVYAGDIGHAGLLIEESAAIALATGAGPIPQAALVVDAWRGRAPDGQAPGPGTDSARIDQATLVASNGLGRYEVGMAAARRAVSLDEVGGSSLLSEAVETASRAGDAGLATEAAQRLDRRAAAVGGTWASGMAARCRALIGAGPVAERNYLDAIEMLGRTLITAELARAHLLYGEWLRREKRRRDAQVHLGKAHAMLTATGADAFASRAERELAAAGARITATSSSVSSQLTAQEARVAGLARDGHSNRQIAEQLFISTATVEYHLHKVFTKLSVSRRSQLRDVL
jgi:DNA-binding CsgD family transcriptional regulator